MTIVALALVAVAVVVIGLGVSLAAFPADAVSITTRIATVFALGCASVLFCGTLLAVAGLFRPLALAVLLAVLTAAAYVVGVRRSTPRAHWTAVRKEVMDDGVSVVASLAVLLLVAVAWLSIPELSLRGGWRYWADGLELADVGGVPDVTAQWGGEEIPDTSKLGGSAFLGAFSFVFREEPFAAMALALWLSTVGYAAALLALGRELGLRWLAPALPLLGIAGTSLPAGIVLNDEIAAKLAFFQNEDLGRMLAAAATVLLVRRPVRAHLESAILGGVLLSAAALTHMIPAVAFGALIAGVLLARVILSAPERRQVAYAAGGIALAGLLTFASLALARGDLGLQGAGSSGRYTLYEGKLDPTAKVKGMNRQPQLKSERRWYEPPLVTVRAAVETTVGRDLTRTAATALVFAAFIAGVVTLVFGARDLRFLIAGATTMGVAILAIALLFSYRYTLYIPATFGRRRLFEYMPIPLTLLALAVVEVAAARLALRRAVLGPALALAVVAAIAIGTARGLGPTDRYDSLRYLRAAVQTPCDSRLLVDRDTRGTFQALTGRISVTEGLLPFLRPTIVNDVLRLREDTDRFFDDPAAGSSILAEQEVDYVIAERSAALAAASGLEQTGTADGLAVYEVTGETESRERPRPTESAGYECFTEAPG